MAMIGLLAAFLGALTVSSAQAGCLDDIRRGGVLTSGNGLLGTKPSLWQAQDGRYEGFDYDLLQQIGRRIGVPKVSFVTTELTSLIPGLKAKRWDIILSDMSVTQERIHNANIKFSSPYFLLYDYVIVKKTSPIQTLADLKDKTLGSTLGTTDSLNAHQLVDTGKAGKVLDYNTLGDPFVALENGQVDALILDQGTLVGQNERLHDLRTVGEPIFYRPKPEWATAEAAAPYKFGAEAIAVRPECTDLLGAIDAALADMDKDGTRKAIFMKYGIWEDRQTNLMK